MREVLGGSRDIETAQASPNISAAGPGVCCKRAATSAAPGSLDHGHNPPQLASAADFSTTQVNEPQSDGLLGPWIESSLPSTHPRASQEIPIPETTGELASPMRVELALLSGDPPLLPLSHNPLQRACGDKNPTRSPPQMRALTHRTRKANTAWLMAEGLIPIGDRFQPAGFVPAQVVGGVTFNIKSPKSRRELAGENLGEACPSQAVHPMLATHTAKQVHIWLRAIQATP